MEGNTCYVDEFLETIDEGDAVPRPGLWSSNSFVKDQIIWPKKMKERITVLRILWYWNGMEKEQMQTWEELGPGKDAV